jgi:hypothetical protein
MMLRLSPGKPPLGGAPEARVAVPRAIRCLPWLLFLVLCAPQVRAQFTSVLEGTITDPSDAVIPGAQVVVENVDTGTSRNVETSASGYYRVASLPPGAFNVRVSAEGFQTSVQEGITLQGTQVKTINIKLEVGQAATTVSVVGDTPLVETGEATVSGHIEEREVADLPLVGRNFITLVVLTPGVTGLPSGGGQAYAQASGDIFSSEYGVNLNANGQRAESNSFLVDSASVNGSPRGGVINYNPNADSVQELRVSVNNFSAEYGRNSSALVNVITKSGTNDLHGTLGWFHTNNKLTARNVFQRDVPVFRRNEVNWSAGGPIIKNRTFAFGSMDILRSGVGAGFSSSAVTPEFVSLASQRAPDSIGTFIMNEFPNQLVRTGTGLVAGQVNGDVDDAAGCNSLPGGSTSPVATPLGEMPCDFPVTFNGTFAQTLPRDGLQWNVRVDHNFNDGNDRIYGSTARTTNDLVLFGAPSIYPAFTAMQFQYTYYFNLHHTHIFSPNVLNEHSFSFTRAWGDAPLNRGEIPAISVPGVAGYGQGFSDAIFIQNNFEWDNVTSWNKGSHSFKFGGIYQCGSGCPGAGALFAAVGERPNYGFNNLFDFVLDDPFSQGNIGFNPQTGESTGIDFRPVFKNFGFFINDDWKVRPNLTISWGVRWETFLNPSDHDDIFVGSNFRGGSNWFERIGDVGVLQKRPLDANDWNNFAPRFGIAWDPTGQGTMSIRAGLGIFYDRAAGQFFRDAQTSLPVYAVAAVNQQTAAQPVFGLSRTNESPWDFPRPEIPGGLDERNGLIGVPTDIQIWQPDLKTQYSANWFFGIQKSLGNDWAVEANYMGSRGNKLYQSYDVNRVPGDLFDGSLDRNNPSFGQIGYGVSNGKSFYHGANFSVKKRYSYGLHFQGAYTVGKAIDYASTFGLGLAMFDIFNLELNRGRADFDIRQKYAMSILYDIPSPVSGGAGKAILGGWQLGAVTILQTGTPYDVRCTNNFEPVRDAGGNLTGNSGCDFNADGFTQEMLNVPSFGYETSTDRQSYLSGLFRVADFGRPGLGQSGNQARNGFTGPGFAGTDLNVTRKFAAPFFGEAGRIDFRFEVFNLFNRVNLGEPNGNIQSSNFGRSTSAFGSRNIQFGLKIVF